MKTWEELRQAAVNVLAEAALVRTFGREVARHEVAYELSRVSYDRKSGRYRFWLGLAMQTDRRFVLRALVPDGEDPDEYCSAMQAWLNVEGVTVEPIEFRGYEAGTRQETYTYEVGKGW